MKIPSDDMDIGEDELDEIKDMGEDDDIFLNDYLANEETEVNANQDDDNNDNPNVNNDGKRTLTIIWKGIKPLRITTTTYPMTTLLL